MVAETAKAPYFWGPEIVGSIPRSAIPEYFFKDTLVCTPMERPKNTLEKTNLGYILVLYWNYKRCYVWRCECTFFTSDSGRNAKIGSCICNKTWRVQQCKYLLKFETKLLLWSLESLIISYTKMLCKMCASDRKINTYLGFIYR